MYVNTSGKKGPDRKYELKKIVHVLFVIMNIVFSYRADRLKDFENERKFNPSRYINNFFPGVAIWWFNILNIFKYCQNGMASK